MAAHPKKPEKGRYYFEREELKEVDVALYVFLQVTHELKLISSDSFHYATTCCTTLLNPIEDL